MAGFSFLNWGVSDAKLPNLYPIPIAETLFVGVDVRTIYLRILMDVLERTEGIPEEKQGLLWDSCVKNKTQDGVLTLMAKAMTDKSDLYLVYHKATDVIRTADPEEQAQIKADYDKQAKSKVGVYITFKDYTLSDMLKFYSAIEYCTVGGLYKGQKLSTAIQIRVSQLRASIGESDSERAIADAKAIARGLEEGKAVMLDKDDVIDTAKPDLSATTTAIDFISKKKSFYLGLPIAWVDGVQKTGMSDSGDADTRAIDRGLKPYFYSIIKPAIDVLLGLNVEFKTEGNDDITMANDTLTTFEATTNEIISLENKTKIANKLYGLPEDEVGDPPEPEPKVTVDPKTGQPIQAVDPNKKPAPLGAFPPAKI